MSGQPVVEVDWREDTLTLPNIFGCFHGLHILPIVQKVQLLMIRRRLDAQECG